MSPGRVILAFCLVLGAVPALAQPRFDVYPRVIYPGDNVITIRAAAGIDEIIVEHTPNVTVTGDGKRSCPRTHDLHVRLATAHLPAELRISVLDCRGQRFDATLPINNTWTLDRQHGTIELGTRRCIEFSIRTDATATLDSVSLPGPGFSLQFPSSLPYTIRGGRIYRYKVCWEPTAEGVFEFPVITWMRRDQPNGGLATYPVADTGVVRVIRPPADRPPETDPPDLPDEPVTDPTTFRSVAVPNAVIPKRGTFVLGVYDVLGIMAGYSITDHVMVLAGGALPLPDDWGGVRGEMFGAASIGAKAGLRLDDRLSVAAGLQWARSIFDQEITRDVIESEISLLAPWGSISYGTDDSRFSLTGGYAFKHHRKPEIEFDEDAAILAFGGDYRLANHWKLAGEVAWMQTVDVLPVLITGRYFGNTYAIDLGIAFLPGNPFTSSDAAPPAFRVAPVLAAVFVF